MKLTTKTEALREAVGFCAQICGGRSPLSAFNYVLLDSNNDYLQIRSSNIAVTAQHTVEAEITSKGSIGLPAKMLKEFLSGASSEETSIEVKGPKAIVKCGNAVATFSTLSPDEFPALPEVKRDIGMSFPEGKFVKALKKVIPAVGDGTKGPIYASVAMEVGEEKVRLIATPGNMVATSEIGYMAAQHPIETYILPAELAQFIAKYPDTELNVSLNESSIEVVSEKWTIQGVLLNDNYVKWRNAIPEEQTGTITLPRKEVIDAIKRVKLFATENFWPIKLDFTKRGLCISSSGGEHAGEATIEFQAPTIKFVINPTFLLDTLTAMEGETAEMGYTNNFMPVTFREEGFLAMIALINPNQN